MPDNKHLTEFLAALESAMRDESFSKLSLGHYKGAETSLKNIYIRKALIRGETQLNFTYRHKTRDIVKNYTYDDGYEKIEEALSNGFQVATLFTATMDLLLENVAGRKSRLKTSAPTQAEAAPVEHNRLKNRHLETEGKTYLCELKITDAGGQVLKTAQDKYKQIDKYIEILSGLIKNIPERDCYKIIDMGSGKGYLTFALYDYLNNTAEAPAQVTGIEYRQDMVDLCNAIARKSQFKQLEFKQGTIENCDASGVNILIALHACNTATDEAIYKGITAEADLIVVAPCCHKQIREQIESHRHSNDLDALMKHGIFVERQAEMVTDTLRALILEYAGYSTKVFEFISDAHTPKNVMIVGTRKTNATAAVNTEALKKINTIKQFFGIEYHQLEKLLKIA